jgi:putative membrane protein
MGKFVLRILINALAILVTAAVLPGITILDNSFGSLLLIGLVIALVNAVVRPILAVLTCPFVILTLGLFIFVINGVMLLLTESLLPERLTIDGLGWAIVGGIVMAIVNMILEGVFGADKDDDGKRKRVSA